MKSRTNNIIPSKKHFLRISTISIAILIPSFFAVLSLIGGHLSLWYDPARDLLSAWNNLSDPTLIGPTSGIPGIFYGPYWIWLLSFGMLFSKDPGVIAFITASLPYLILFPLIWFRFSKIWGLTTVVCGWLLFMLSTGGSYATQLWNPHPAPLFTLIVVYLLFVINFDKASKMQIMLAAVAGFFLGLLTTFHISFGIALICGVLIFLLAHAVHGFLKSTKRKQFVLARATLYGVVALGFLTAYIPTLLFEVRHGFNQTQVLLNALTSYGDVVTVKGLSKPLIFQEFINSFAKVLHVPANIAIAIIILLPATYIVMMKRGMITMTQADRRILMLLLSLLGGILLIYFTARNPVWTYHFIGVELILLLLAIFFISKISFYKIALVAWTVVITFMSLSTQITMINAKQDTGFNEQKNIVKTVVADAKGDQYGVLAYSASIYMYDYSYLFQWLANKDVPYDPSANKEVETIYLIVPNERDAKVSDFINYRTPSAMYVTERTWKFQYNTVLKRVKVE